ncbi:hypothetical protein [Streptomyces sp. NBC_01363]|uniref:hypothetical protein n=1 Tax=Streptomyces sp. NBC_01363 TaxID=2903840 RepID=UPI0022524D88|nr:hypothetical protein [Streptomyces sp. NBC_01363]MCX4734432.1 hypothetical protein [Streptomyces sp. NBC_01363]
MPMPVNALAGIPTERTCPSFFDLVQQRVEADVARMGLDVGQHRLHVFFVVRTVAVHGLDVVALFAVAGRIGEDQRVQQAGTRPRDWWARMLRCRVFVTGTCALVLAA